MGSLYRSAAVRYERLRLTLEDAPNHLPIAALCADVDGEGAISHIASNDGNSSSMLEFGRHVAERPEVEFIRTDRMTSRRLDTAIDEICVAYPQMDPYLLDCLVLDVQSSELRVPQGAHRCLSRAS